MTKYPIFRPEIRQIKVGELSGPFKGVGGKDYFWLSVQGVGGGYVKKSKFTAAEQIWLKQHDLQKDLAKEDEAGMMKVVRIGYLDYKVIDTEDLKDEEVNDLFGQIVHDVCEIRINKRLIGPVKLVTKWHEIIHGILSINGGYSEDHNEQLISVIAHGILQVLADNPDLIKELVNACSSTRN